MITNTYPRTMSAKDLVLFQTDISENVLSFLDYGCFVNAWNVLQPPVFTLVREKNRRMAKAKAWLSQSAPGTWEECHQNAVLLYGEENVRLIERYFTTYWLAQFTW